MIKPKAAPARWPYLEHRKMDQVMRREEINERAREANRRKWLLKRGEIE